MPSSATARLRREQALGSRCAEPQRRNAPSRRDRSAGRRARAAAARRRRRARARRARASGKTTLVRGAARALGVSDPVTSPTFSIGHRYAAASVTVSHLDLYRLAGLEHEDPALLADYLGPGRIAFVEWPEDGARELAGRAPAGDAQPRGRRPAAHRGRRAAPDEGRGAMIVLGFDTATAGHRRRAARWPDGPRASARDDPARGRAPGPRDAAAGDGRRAARRRRASAGAQSSGSPSGSARARSPACASASPPRAGSHSRWRSSWSAVSSLQALAARRALRPTERGRARAHGGARRDRRPPRRGVRGRLRACAGEDCRASWRRRARSRPSSSRELIAAARADAGGGAGSWLAVGDGAVRFRDAARALPGVAVAPEDSPLHRVERRRDLRARRARGARLALEADRARLPRRPDAELALERRRGASRQR